MDFPVFRRIATYGVLVGAAGVIACGGEVSPTAIQPLSTTPVFAVGDTPALGAEPTATQIVLCKTGNVDGTFTIANTPVNGSLPTVVASPVTVPKGTCKVIVQDLGGSDVGSFTTITETSAGFVSAAARFYDGADGSVSDQPYTTGVTQLFTNNFHGWRITYDNFVSPPLETGGQGCSPGYWKNHNFPAGYTKGQMFSSVFEDAFPGKSLQTVLSTGGGGLTALGRHTVSALLNAASLGTNYELTVAEVIAKFNAVYPDGDYSGLAAEFAALQDVDGRICPNPTGK